MVHKIKSVLLGFTFFILASTYITAGSIGDEVISEEVKQQIISDISINEKELEAYQEDFIDYYVDEIHPRIDNLDDYILSSSINMIEDGLYVLWTEGISPSSWGGNEFLYVISTETGSSKILSSIQLDPTPSRTNDGYRQSVYWPKPNKGCGYNDFVEGILQYGVFGGSGSTFSQIYVEYNRYENSYTLRATTSPVAFSEPACLD